MDQKALLQILASWRRVMPCWVEIDEEAYSTIRLLIANTSEIGNDAQRIEGAKKNAEGFLRKAEE